jgi:hypothetical protein
MLLSVVERLTLLGILPEQGNLTTIKIVARLREELSFDEQEHARLNFRPSDDGQRVQWDITGSMEKDIEIGPKALGVVYDALKALDDKEALTAQHLSLCEKFGYPEEG